MPEAKYALTFRLQDELHLLRDALGAVDAHYEALIDHLQHETTGTAAKILGHRQHFGYQHQVDVLYRRSGRVFCSRTIRFGQGFGRASGERFGPTSALAPRVRHRVRQRSNSSSPSCSQRSDGLALDPDGTCAEIGVPAEKAPLLLSLYGT